MSVFAVDRIQLVKGSGEESSLKAFASIKIADVFVVKNLKVVEGKNGIFVSMPQEKYESKEGEVKYADNAYPMSKEGREEINQLVIKAYEAAAGKV